jgi:hypothetical protein
MLERIQDSEVRGYEEYVYVLYQKSASSASLSDFECLYIPILERTVATFPNQSNVYPQNIMTLK